MKQSIVITLLLIWGFSLFAQLPTITDIDFITEKIKTVYAGYKEKVKKGDFLKLVEEVKKDNCKDTFQLFSKLTLFFNDHHLALYQRKWNKEIDTNLCATNYKMVNEFNISKFSKDSQEGYWINDLNNLIIFLKEEKNIGYFGYIVESKKTIPIGFCNLKLYQKKNGKFLTDYIDVHREFRVFTKSFFKNKNVLVCNSFSKWIKIYNYKPGMLQTKVEFNNKPGLIVLDSTTVLLKMHNLSSSGIYKLYDSLINANEKVITSCRNFLIDLRNNAGGGTRSVSLLLPFICEHPIYRVAGYELCSADVIMDAEKAKTLALDKKDSITIFESEKYLKKLYANKGKFLYIPSDTLQCLSKPSLIKNVGIIINHGCRSAAELAILLFKQISKVTVFGETTAGGVDYLDLLQYTLPKTNYIFWVGTTKRKITKSEPQYDNIGIDPDIVISDDEEDWIQFVKHYYEKK